MHKGTVQYGLISIVVGACTYFKYEEAKKMARCSVVCLDFSQIVEELNDLAEESVEETEVEETEE